MRCPFDRVRGWRLRCARSPSPRPLQASEQFGDVRRRRSRRSRSNARGEALVTYRTSADVLRHVYVWGAINAVAPDPGVRQVHFRFDYSGGVERRTAGRPGRRSGTAAAPTTDRGSPGSWRHARRRTARTGHFSAGSACCRCVASSRSSPGRRRTSFTSRTGRGLCPCSRSRRTGPTAAGGRGFSAASPTTGHPVFGFRTPSSRRRRSQRTLLLRRHLQLGLRGGVEARCRQGRAQRQRRVLLQLRAPARRRPAIRRGS